MVRPGSAVQGAIGVSIGRELVDQLDLAASLFSRTGTPTSCGRTVWIATITSRAEPAIDGDLLESMTFVGVPGLE